MFLAKLGLLSCAFYALVIVLLEAALWMVTWIRGEFALFVPQRYWGLRIGLLVGLVLGLAWLVSFAGAWWLVYSDMKSKFPPL